MAQPPAPELEQRVADAITAAGATLLSLPSVGAVRGRLHGAVPAAFIDSAVTAYCAIDAEHRLVPTERKIADMMTAFRWIQALPNMRVRRVLLLRSLIHPRTGSPFWTIREMSEVFRVDSSSIEGWHKKGISLLSTASQRRQCGDLVLRTFVTPGSGFLALEGPATACPSAPWSVPGPQTPP